MGRPPGHIAQQDVHQQRRRELQRTNPTRRVDIKVAILHESDVDEAMRVLQRIAEADPACVADKGVSVRVNEVREAALWLELRFWVARAELVGARTRTYVTVAREFRAAGLELAVPLRRTVATGPGSNGEASEVAPALATPHASEEA